MAGPFQEVKIESDEESTELSIEELQQRLDEQFKEELIDAFQPYKQTNPSATANDGLTFVKKEEDGCISKKEEKMKALATPQ